MFLFHALLGLVFVLMTQGDTNSSDTSSLAPSCVPGVKVGPILVTQPNISSFVFVGNSATVQWKYSVLVKNIPQTVDIKVFMPANPTKMTLLVAGLDVTNGATAWKWKVAQFETGPYKVHIVPEGKETMGKKQDELPCFANGDAMPGKKFFVQ